MLPFGKVYVILRAPFGKVCVLDVIRLSDAVNVGTCLDMRI